MGLPSLPTETLDARVAEAVAVIRGRTPLVPEVALTLGSGLGGVIDHLEDAVTFPTSELPHWPRSTVAGHAGRLAIGTWCGVTVVALAGRSHRYEGYTLDRVTFGVRVMYALGARTMIFTNAVGAIHPDYRSGDIMVATDAINFIGKRGLFTPSELAERSPISLAERSPKSRAERSPKSRAEPSAGRRVASHFSPALRGALLDAAARAGEQIHRGTLMGGLGPTYETAAEVRMGAAIGADVACMSTVHEVLVAAELGCECASLSCITNRATGLSKVKLLHQDVTEVADRVARRMRAILEEYLKATKPGRS